MCLRPSVLLMDGSAGDHQTQPPNLEPISITTLIWGQSSRDDFHATQALSSLPAQNESEQAIQDRRVCVSCEPSTSSFSRAPSVKMDAGLDWTGQVVSKVQSGYSSTRLDECWTQIKLHIIRNSLSGTGGLAIIFIIILIITLILTHVLRRLPRQVTSGVVSRRST